MVMHLPVAGRGTRLIALVTLLLATFGTAPMAASAAPTLTPIQCQVFGSDGSFAAFFGTDGTLYGTGSTYLNLPSGVAAAGFNNNGSCHDQETPGPNGACTTQVGAAIQPGIDVNGNGRCTDYETPWLP